MLRGLTTVSDWTADIEAAKKWYAELLGIEPYFEVPGASDSRLLVTKE
jgi:catechol 2,3-dioxygenase-like lactoylglutathione lyase family enzyme